LNEDIPGRLWLDVSTTQRAGSLTDGTTRSERRLIEELPRFVSPALGFCVYDRTLKRFSAIAAPASQPIGARPLDHQPKQRGPLRNLGRRIEAHGRRAVKAAAARGIALAERARDRNPFPDARPGDMLLLAGENWSRFDFDVLRKLLSRSGIRIAAILQDMITALHPQLIDSKAFVARFQSYVEFLVRDTDIVLVISESTRRDFLAAMERIGNPRCRVARIELGADFAAAEGAARPAELNALGDRPFLLSVSTIQARKNFDLLYRLWQRFAVTGQRDHPHLVIAGRPGFGSNDLLHLMRNDPWIADSVTVLHGASDAELSWLYSNCLFTLYPSWYEGWGLPVSESLHYGKTFIASDRSSLPEAGQGLGIHVDPYDHLGWEREILRLSNDAGARQGLEARIATEYRRSSWADCARQIAAVLTTDAENAK
jgi:glycosyltransferase involved in cell wall biosynthesis